LKAGITVLPDKQMD